MKITEPISSILAGRSPKDIWRVSPEDTVFHAIKLMSEKNIGAVLVMKGDKLVGILSERDYARKVILKGHASRETSVKDVMTAEIVCINPTTSIESAMTLITQKRIRHLPVMDEDRLVGIVSIGDLVKRIINAQEAMIGQLENYVTGAYPA